MGRVSYHGGSTIIKTWRRAPEEGWEPEKIALKRRHKKNRSANMGRPKYSHELKRMVTPFELAFIQFAKDCANADMTRRPRSIIPLVIRKLHPPSKLTKLLNRIANTPFYSDEVQRIRAKLSRNART